MKRLLLTLSLPLMPFYRSITDIKPAFDAILPMPKEGTKGVRVMVSDLNG